MNTDPGPRIVVVGSLNIDHTLSVPRLPRPGETLTASGWTTGLGGKGANQALAAARAGGQVALIGCVGNDAPGAAYLAHLESEHIQTRWIRKVPAPTGAAHILVEASGENCIVVHPGANHALTPEDVREAASLIESADALLLQLECPLPAVFQAIALARAAGVHTLLNPSPVTREFAQAMPEVDTLLVNTLEASVLSGVPKEDLEATGERLLQKIPCSRLILTRGGDSTLCISSTGVLAVPPPRVQPVDTVGAGDAFAGAYAVAVAKTTHARMEDALRFANAAGALATLRPGAQTAMPKREEILALLNTP